MQSKGVVEHEESLSAWGCKKKREDGKRLAKMQKVAIRNEVPRHYLAVEEDEGVWAAEDDDESSGPSRLLRAER